VDEREHLWRLAQQKRESAARARTLAEVISLHADQQRLLRQAAELEEQARQLEQQFTAAKPPDEPT
jgi:hypothetical protein